MSTKTITMSLEEYEQDQARARTSIENRSYTKGGLDVIECLRKELIYRLPYGSNNRELSNAMDRLIKDIRDHFRPGVVGNKSDEL